MEQSIANCMHTTTGLPTLLYIIHSIYIFIIIYNLYMCIHVYLLYDICSDQSITLVVEHNPTVPAVFVIAINRCTIIPLFILHG